MRIFVLLFKCVEMRSLQRVFFKIHLMGMLFLCFLLHFLLNTIPKFDELNKNVVSFFSFIISDPMSMSSLHYIYKIKVK